ncbi:MAG: zinc ribbon domain-containing protein [bacterium]|nr:zinc ribbon domain-containing protein [bacterium]
MRVPIYEFRCDDCRRKFETLCRMGEDGSSLACPGCGGKRLRRCVSTFSAFSRDGGGSGTRLGGSGCSTCKGGSCQTCH